MMPVTKGFLVTKGFRMPGCECPKNLRNCSLPITRHLSLVVLLLCFLVGACQPSGSKGSLDSSSSAPVIDEPKEFVEMRKRMVADLRTIIADQRVLEVMARVPRHEFVPLKYRHRSYATHSALPINENQTISAPDIVAIMTETLKLDGDERVLEIGTGSGYQAAILGELVPEVYSVEIRERLATSASALLDSLRKKGLLRYNTIEVIHGDGYQGYEAKAPYDAIIVTAAPKEVPALLMNQLKDGGRMVIPVGDFHQELQVITNRGGKFIPQKILPVRFVPMVKEKE